MAYEIDFVGVGADKSSQDADAICIRWKYGIDSDGNPQYKIGVVDGGFEAHGEAMVNHMNQYYFDDADGKKSPSEKTVDFMVVTHPDQDHTSGLKKVLENFNVTKIYMNLPWLYVDDLFGKVSDGRITKESLKKRLREKYKTIANIADMAETQGIPIFEAFQGESIEENFLILSPSRDFYLQLLVESEKTPLEESSSCKSTFEKFSAIVKKSILSLLESWTKEMLREDVNTSAENETSIVLRGMVDSSGFLLTGDVGIRGLEKSMDYMDGLGEDIQTQISFYQIPHHGGRHNVSPSILDRMLGGKVKEGETRSKAAFASVAEESDHPLKMVTNAYIRRGVKVSCTSGCVICYCNGDMPDRGWGTVTPIEFSNYVEEWNE